MKTQTSKQKKWLFSLLILPVLGILFYSFSERKIVEVPLQNEISEKNTSILEKKHTARSISIKVLGNNNYEVDGIKTTKTSLVATVNQLHQDISSEVRNKIINIHLTFEGEESNEEVWFIYNSLLDYGFHRLVTKNQEVVRSKGNTPISDNKNSDKQQKLPTAKEIAAYNAWAKKINSKSTTFATGEKLLPPVDEQNLIKYAGIHNRMSAAQKRNAEKMPFPGFEYVKGTEASISVSPNAEQQNPATAKEVAEYNAWAKKLKEETLIAQKNEQNGKPAEYPIVKQKDLMKYQGIYSRMTDKQKAESAPHPVSDKALKAIKFPPPPPPVKQQNPPTAKEVADYNAWTKKMNTQISKAETNKKAPYPIIKQKDIARYKSIYSRMTDKQKKDAEVFPNFPPPPPPPPPFQVKQYKNGKKKTLNQIIKETPKNAKSGYEVLDNGESHYFIIYGGKKTYYNKDGFITDDKGNVLPPPPPPVMKKNK